MTSTRAARRAPIAVTVLLAVAVVAVVALFRAGDSGDGAGREARAPTAGEDLSSTGTPSDVVRATGPGSCAFLSTEDVARAGGVSQAELRQTLGPNGNPGCEWVLGDDRRVLQLEFQPGRAPAPPAQGEDVAGPWQAGKWVASTRTLHVEANGQVLFVRASDNDPARAKEVAVAVAALAAARN